MDERPENRGVVELGQGTLQANKEHLDALRAYTQKLEAELGVVDELLHAVDTVDESDLDMGRFVTIPGAVRATAPIGTKELLSLESPFREDVLKRSRYRSFSEVRPMKTKELEALAGAVQAESYRSRSLDIQKRGLQAFPGIDVQATHTPWLNAKDIDWSRVAERVSTASMTTRTARECEIRWLGEQQPEFNHEPWSQEEVLKVKSLATEFRDSQPDWVNIAERLATGRTPLDCMRHAISRKSHQWTTETDKRLLKAVHNYGHDNWYLVARYVSEDATPSQCSNRFQRVLDESIKRTAWSPEEDARLSASVAAYGSSWVDVAANLPGRHNDQCRERWTSRLNPSIKRGQWSKEEDKFLLDYVHEHKNASWKEISGRLGNGRTEAMCRNRHTVLQKSIKAMSTVQHKAGTILVDQATILPDSASTSSSALGFEPSYSSMYPCPVTPASFDTDHHPNQFVFLEPVATIAIYNKIQTDDDREPSTLDQGGYATIEKEKSTVAYGKYWKIPDGGSTGVHKLKSVQPERDPD